MKRFIQLIEIIWEYTESFLERFWKRIEPFAEEWGIPMVVATFFCVTSGYMVIIFVKSLAAFIQSILW